MKISNLVPAHPPEKYTLRIKNTFPTSFLPSILIRFELHSGEKKNAGGGRRERRRGSQAGTIVDNQAALLLSPPSLN